MTDWETDCLHWRGQVLTGAHAHWCFEWDELPIDETCPEWPCCDVAYRTLPRTLKKWASGGFRPRRGSARRLTRRWHRASVLRRDESRLVWRLDGVTNV